MGINDGASNSSAVTSTITWARVNDAPTLTHNSTTAFTEDSSTNKVGSLVASFTATDPESDQLTISLSDTANYKLSSLETFDTVPSGWSNAKIDSSTSLGAFLGR